MESTWPVSCVIKLSLRYWVALGWARVFQAPRCTMFSRQDGRNYSCGCDKELPLLLCLVHHLGNHDDVISCLTLPWLQPNSRVHACVSGLGEPVPPASRQCPALPSVPTSPESGELPLGPFPVKATALTLTAPIQQQMSLFLAVVSRPVSLH